MGHFPSYYIFNGLLFILQVLHVIWFYMIAKMAVTYIVKGQVKFGLFLVGACINLYVCFSSYS